MFKRKYRITRRDDLFYAQIKTFLHGWMYIDDGFELTHSMSYNNNHSTLEHANRLIDLYEVKDAFTVVITRG